MKKCTACLLAFILLGTGFSQHLEDVTGVTELRTSENQPWRPAQNGDAVSLGHSMRTFQGELTLRYDANTFFRLNHNSELSRLPFYDHGYELVAGSAYVEGENLTVFMDNPIDIYGSARFDVIEEQMRAVSLQGYLEVNIGANKLRLEPGQQLTISKGEVSVADYFERDPWYRQQISLGSGIGRVIGFEGTAELKSDDEVWGVVEKGHLFLPGTSARTGMNAWLEIAFEANIIRLQADSEIELSQLEAFEDGTERTVLALTKGKVWAIVENEGQPFEIETPGLVAGVRGTKFRVDTATDDEPALIKTFEGEVVGIQGLESISVEEGEQFDPLSGLEELKLDELDLFNLARDQLLAKPVLDLTELPGLTHTATVALKGQTDGTLLSLNQQQLEQREDIDLVQGLLPGFNLIDVRASFGEGGAEARFIRPVIRSGYEPIFYTDFEVLSDSKLRLNGLVSPYATVTLTDEAGSRETVANRHGKFQFLLPNKESSYQLTVTLTSGLTTEHSLQYSD